MELATADYPVIRMVGVGTESAWHACFARWAERVAAWIGAGRHPTVFVHTADDRDVPTSCAAFHAALSRHIGVGSIPAWPACPGAAGGEQISLFDP